MLACEHTLEIKKLTLFDWSMVRSNTTADEGGFYCEKPRAGIGFVIFSHVVELVNCQHGSWTKKTCAAFSHIEENVRNGDIPHSIPE